MNPAYSNAPGSPPSVSDDYGTKLLLVDSTGDVAQHPKIASFLQNGWRIRRSEPRLVESDCKTQFLVVLERTIEDESLTVTGG